MEIEREKLHFLVETVWPDQRSQTQRFSLCTVGPDCASKKRRKKMTSGDFDEVSSHPCYHPANEINIVIDETHSPIGKP